MRILFVGAVEFSRQCLEETLAYGADVVAVLTLPRELAGSHGDYADLEPAAREHDVPVHRIQNVNDVETIALVRSLEPDVIFVLGWSQLLGPALLSVAPCIGSHPALLPRNRGRHPLTWALVEGLDESGLTFLWLEEGTDSGDIVWQRRFRIGQDDDAGSLYATICRLGREAVRELLPQLESGSAPRIPQDDALATYWRKRTDADRWIDWTATSAVVHNLVRGLARPYVGALTRCGGQDVTVWSARLPDEPLSDSARAAAPGTVLTDPPEPTVRTGDAYLTLSEIDPVEAVRAGDALGGPA